MKFEIEDNLVVIDTGEGFTELVRAQDLEAILQAVKKTQEKIVNRQIQEIQDSKKPSNYYRTDISLEQIEQNQKIVDAIKKQNDSDSGETWYAIDEYCNRINELVKNATGKDIQSLFIK